ncbi:glutaredoxin family protein [Dokdonella sp. MW10]|uniref:glutaredoxin family protein n=1 Tax=Dokdonella sp. MW10 TaxID=2992926 RepID=UPI003F804BD6
MRLPTPLRLAALACTLLVLVACGRVDNSALRAEIGSEPVVMLTTAWCGYCAKMRTQLDSWGVRYTEVDVEADASGQRAFRLANGRGVPILVIGDETIHGYSPDRAHKALASAGLLPKVP